MKLYVNLVFHYVEERLPQLNKVINDILAITTEETKIVLLSNKKFDCPVQVDVIENLDRPKHLTWQHKRYMWPAMLQGYTHYAYIEGDINFTQKNMDYWLKNTKLFKENNLNFIPAMFRIEYNNKKQVFSSDVTDYYYHLGHNPAYIEKEIVIGGKRFASLLQPYQGMFIMDREMVEEHINSDYFRLGELHGYLIMESANLGNMYVNVPEGFQHRALVPIDNMEEFSQSWVHHISNNLHPDPENAHGKVPVDILLHRLQNGH